MAFRLFLLLVVLPSFVGVRAASFGLDVHHRFSEPVRRWADSARRDFPGGWPEKGSVGYYAALAGHDLSRYSSSSSLGGTPDLAFAEGNVTLRVSSLGFLHYALVTIGTPSSTFLVALDTGSDLFWVPCDCTSCVQAISSGNRTNAALSIYSPHMSLTSQRLLCSSSFCELQSECYGSTSVCPYNISYVSADTSSSGILVEDILYLTTEGSQAEVVEARVVFGCGQVQTGSFLDTAAPNGLFGLGMEKISVPSILSRRGLIPNSFSMCFGQNGIGRIHFGDKGSLDQKETPFNLNERHNTYNISITGIVIGNGSSDITFSALIDSGTSFAYLADPAYAILTENFNALVKDKHYKPASGIPFEYCYSMSPHAAKIQFPYISFTTRTGSQFPVTDPIIVISDQQQEYVYCLAVVKSSNLNIIGQNFLTGLHIVFDREREILGWKKSNCYDAEDSSPLPVNIGNPSAQPRIYNPEASKGSGNGSEITELSPPLINPSFMHPIPTAFRILCLLLVAIL